MRSLVGPKEPQDHSAVDIAELGNSVHSPSSLLTSYASSQSYAGPRSTSSVDLSAPGDNTLRERPPEAHTAASDGQNPGSLQENPTQSGIIASRWKDIPAQSVSWTMQHSFYVLMGGFTIPITKVSVTKGGDGASLSYSRITLTLEGYEWLVRHAPDVLPNITRDEIMDKSKADGLVKLLAVIQAVWFSLQCITRLSQNLTITLLEIHVLGHAICVVLIYLLWWSKPFDVNHATVLTGEKIENIAVLFLFLNNSVIPGNGVSLLRAGHWVICREGAQQEPRPSQLDVPIEPNDHLLNFTYAGTQIKTVEPAEMEQLQAASQALSMLGMQEPQKLGSYLQSRAKNFAFPWDDHELVFYLKVSSYLEGLAIRASITAACAAFGALHLISWFAPFRQPMEMQLWRVSATAITCTGPALLLWVQARLNTEWYLDSSVLGIVIHGREIRIQITPNPIFIKVITLSFLLVFAFARTFIVVECFINLAYIPESALATPKWSRYVPHLS